MYEANLAKSSIIERVRAEITCRSKKPATPPNFTFTFPFPRRLPSSTKALLLQHCPFPAEIKSKIRITIRPNDTIGCTLFNGSSVAVKSQADDIHPCLCEQLRQLNPDKPEVFRGGHLATNDITCLFPLINKHYHSALLKIWEQGSKFRAANTIDDATSIFMAALQRFSTSLGEEMPDMRKYFQLKPQLAHWYEQVKSTYTTLATREPNFVLPSGIRSVFTFLRKNFVITPVDKNPQSMAIMCTREYMKRLRDHMNSPTYATTPLSEEQQILEKHKKFNERHGFEHYNALPYLYIIPKLHKEPARPFDRFITGHTLLNRSPPPDQTRHRSLRLRSSPPSASLSEIGRYLSDYLNAIIDLLILEDKKSVTQGAPKKIWIIRDMNEPLEAFSSAQHIFTNDFSTMYTMFPLDEMEKSTITMIKKALRYASSQYFPTTDWDSIYFCGRDDTKEARWTKDVNEHTKGWNFSEASSVLKFILRNSFYKNCFGIVHQIIGVGMGSEPSQPIANLALAHRELLWIENFQRQGVDIRSLFGNFRRYCRYIDDLASDVPIIPNNYFDMPLVNTGSTVIHPSVDFLMFTFTKREFLPLQVSIREKQRSFPIALIRYPGNITTMPNECKIGCVVGGLVTIYRHIDSPSIFSAEIHRLFSLLCNRGFTKRHIRDGVRKFLARNVRPEHCKFIFHNFLQHYIEFWPSHHSPLPVAPPPSYDSILLATFDVFRNSELPPQRCTTRENSNELELSFYTCSSSPGYDLVS